MTAAGGAVHALELMDVIVRRIARIATQGAGRAGSDLQVKVTETSFGPLRV